MNCKMFIGFRKIGFMVCALCYLALGVNAYANKYYIGLKSGAVGGFKSVAEDFSSDKSKDDSKALPGTYAFSVGTELNLLDRQPVKLELEYNLQGAKNFADLVFKAEGNDGYSSGLLSHSMMLNLSPVFNVTDDIKVIPTVGLGFAINKSTDKSIMLKEGNHLAYSYGLLMGKNLTDNIELQTGYKRVSLGSVKSDNINYKAFDFDGGSSKKTVGANHFVVGLNLAL